jgi:hypothetical protein
MPLVAADMGRQEPVHPATQVGVVRGPGRQVEVIGHQAVGEVAHRDADARLGHHVDERIVVVGLVEDGGSSSHAQNATTCSLLVGHRHLRGIRRVPFPPPGLEDFCGYRHSSVSAPRVGDGHSHVIGGYEQPLAESRVAILAVRLVNCGDPIVHRSGPNLEGSESEIG